MLVCFNYQTRIAASPVLFQEISRYVRDIFRYVLDGFFQVPDNEVSFCEYIFLPINSRYLLIFRLKDFFWFEDINRTIWGQTLMVLTDMSQFCTSYWRSNWFLTLTWNLRPKGFLNVLWARISKFITFFCHQMDGIAFILLNWHHHSHWQFRLSHT